MRPKSMILILIALGCGLIASIGISQVVERGGDDTEVQMQQIYVAVEDIDIGEELTAQRVKLENWPIDRVPVGAITTAEQLEGQAPRQRLFAGEPILIGKLANTDDLVSASHRIKPGHRVMSVKVAMDTAVSHLIQPGDHVDILAFIAGNRGVAAKAETILSNIEVFAINDQTTRNTDQESTSMQAKTVSLQVTPDQAKSLTYYVEQGRLRLTLRSPDDKAIVGNKPPTQARPVETVRPQATQFVAQSAPDDRFRMQVLDSSGSARVFVWDENGEESGLPQEITEGGESSGSDTREPAAAMPPFQPTGEAPPAEQDGPEASERLDHVTTERGIQF